MLGWHSVKIQMEFRDNSVGIQLNPLMISRNQGKSLPDFQWNSVIIPMEFRDKSVGIKRNISCDSEKTQRLSP